MSEENKMNANIIINGKESQLPFGQWFEEYLIEEADDEITDITSYYTEKEIKKYAKEYFKEMDYIFKKYENNTIYVIDKYDY